MSEHIHHYVLPTIADARGALVGVCACGATKDHYPDKPASWTMQAKRQKAALP